MLLYIFINPFDFQFLPLGQADNIVLMAHDDEQGGQFIRAFLPEALSVQVLARDSLMDILARFIHLDVEEKNVATEKGIKRLRKETMIFPRYHQLDAVRALTYHAQANGAGHNYLIQHSAGSGKSNSIAWLAHRLCQRPKRND